MPDLKALAAGAAGMPYDVTRSLRDFWRKMRDHKLSAIASILESFDRFTKAEWAMTGPEALEAHGELFEDLEPYWDELAEAEPDPAAVDKSAEMVGRLWRQLLHQQQEGGNA